jgi:hypothetical protein
VHSNQGSCRMEKKGGRPNLSKKVTVKCITCAPGNYNTGITESNRTKGNIVTDIQCFMNNFWPQYFYRIFSRIPQFNPV